VCAAWFDDHVPTGFWLKPDSNIIMQLVEENKTANGLQRHCVKGHQDLVKERKDFTLPELHNVEANKEATTMRFKIPSPATHVIPFPASVANVHVRQQLISSSLNTLLHAERTRTGCWKHSQEKFNWTPTTRKLIAWDICHKHLNDQPNKQHQQLIKHSVEWLPTGYKTHQHNPLEDH
jgi:hypothetical protein